MAVDFITSQPQNLLNAFKGRIKQSEPKGKITTWEIDADGDFTHRSDNWRNLAWFRPVVKQGVLTFNILKSKNGPLAIVTYGYYHGHLTETFLNHFDDLFSQAVSTAKGTSQDIVS